MKTYLKLLRVEQWVKNLFVFLPMFFSGNLTNGHMAALSIVAFLLFSFTASSIYIINDYNDIAADREHPEKKFRPLASGDVSKNAAKTIFLLLWIMTATVLTLSAFLLHFSWQSLTAVLAVYFIMNLAYTFRLKHVAIVDIFIIAAGFVLRVLAGGCATQIPISQWALLLTFLLALVLAIGKRRGELINARRTGKTRRALDGYNVQFADIALSISCTLAVVCYVMFTLSPEVQHRFHPRVFYTVIFVVFAFLRYLQQTLVYNSTESPTKVIYRDRYIQLTLLAWLAVFLMMIYFK